MSLPAWRTWEVDRGWLHSPVMSDFWAPGEPMTAGRCAMCVAGFRRDYPNRDRCSCGLYSYIAPEECAWQSHWPLKTGQCVMGTVAVWGRTVPHVRGYRSLYVRLTALYLWPDPPGKTVETCLRYPVPILQANLQPWWDPAFVEGRWPDPAAGETWAARKREEGTA